MEGSEFKVEEFLKQNNVKPSYQRIKIYDYLIRHNSHPTVDEIYQVLLDEIPTLSKTTVYNTLKLFLDKEIVQLITIEENETRYDVDVSLHGHFKCLGCGGIYDVWLDMTSIKLEGLDEFVINESHIYLKGSCNKCLVKLISQGGIVEMKKFACTVCGLVHIDEAVPEKCVQCGALAAKFTEKKDVEEVAYFEQKRDVGEMVYADEHKIGIAKGVDSEIIQDLKANFMGECTEVGMYLAMSRQADREGFPEIAEAYKRIAFEEAEHAAKFAELLGEVVEADTKANLWARVQAEHGACQGKKDLASKAKQLGYDAIHDTVHEMCKDEARHGQAFAGLLKRYFDK